MRPAAAMVLIAACAALGGCGSGTPPAGEGAAVPSVPVEDLRGGVVGLADAARAADGPVLLWIWGPG